MTPPRTQQIPVVVLAGFLGSGKTTLLNHLLRNRAGTRIGVIVNDFGSIEIDAMTVAGQVGSTVSLGNGCMCCAVDASELDTFLKTLTRPSARLDLIVIEASGLAEPQELVRMLLASENPHILYGGLVEVVDAAEFDGTRERHPEIDRHLAAADLVVLNKTDRVGEAEQELLRRTVAELSGPAAVISAVHGRIDPELLFDPALRPDGEEKARQLTFEDLLREEGHDHEDHAGHLHAAYESVDFTSDLPLDPRRFIAFLDSRPEGVYRIKGFADFGAGDRDNKYALHAVGRFLRFVPQPWALGEQRLTQLVMIGAGIDAEALRAGLTACRAEPAESAAPTRASADTPDAERSMWGVLRYVQQETDPEDAPVDMREAAAEA
ncbi:cobalamin biosynthesis protein CobW [Streptomyces sp. CB00316]|uniref:CobW family GTP-binding protein n=1 Tax=unclassified Streptomyces TaxID=2593676 RepID=UPI0009398F01|nr:MULTISPECIES: GTP-binding protein [unclassified Streptomyces]MBT2378920.1 GTP-binding protein [Streptomyces sp. ISL-111]OKJ14188.1 cobalamin biosynthesis protein CobW [Streptomyces sp. CB00316]